MDVAASEFYGTDKTYDLNFKEEVSVFLAFYNFYWLHYLNFKQEDMIILF